MNKLRRSLAVLFHRDRFARELEEEMAAHVEMQAEENRAGGMGAEEACYAARRQFGNATYLAEESRRAWGWNAGERFGCDVRFALRVFGRNRGFTAAAVLTLALGIGGNTAIFSMVDAFLFRPAPVRDRDRLVSIADRTAQHRNWPISYPNFADWKRDNQVFERMAAYRVRSSVVTDDAGADRVPGLEVSDGFFDILGMRPALGRTFVPEEHQPRGVEAALISYELWQRRYGGSAGVLGKTVAVDGGHPSIVGVAAPGFRIGPRADVYVPLEREGRREGRDAANSLYAIGRLRAGVTWEQARANMDAIAVRLEELYPKTNAGHRVDLVPFGQLRRGEVRPPLLMLLGAVALVLLIACVNISSLLLAKASGRAPELAIRQALGASRGRLIAQLLTESMVLAVAGGAAGLLMGNWGSRGLVWLIGDLDKFPGGAPLGGVGVDTRVFVFTALLAVATGVIMGVVPALHTSKAALTGRHATRGNRHILDILVASEVALALVLLCGAGLLLRSFRHLVTVERGFDARRVLTLSLARAERRLTRDDCARILEGIEGLPGVESAASSFPLPFGPDYSGDDFEAEAGPDRKLDVQVQYVSPGYFRTLGMRLLAGRRLALSDQDRGAVVNEALAREVWRGEDAIGKRFRLGPPAAGAPWTTVVGVAANTREHGLHSEPGPQIYVPVSGSADILVRTVGDPAAMAPAIRARIRMLDRSQAVYDVYPLADRISNSVRDDRTLVWLLGIFAAMAVLLAAIGIYAVISHAVKRRTAELGIRMALGAEPGDVRNLVLRQAMPPVVAGVVIGLAGAYGATRVLAGLLFGITTADPPTYIAVTLVLGGLALAACYLPARRATKIDPVEALRYE